MNNVLHALILFILFMIYSSLDLLYSTLLNFNHVYI